MDNIKTMRILDLFAGTGAFSLAFHSSSNHKVKYTTVMANDYEKASETIYKENFPQENFVLGDINTIDVSSIPTHDILCGGFPCQPFSIAGHQEGFNDERSNVFWKILEIRSFLFVRVFKTYEPDSKTPEYALVKHNLPT